SSATTPDGPAAATRRAIRPEVRLSFTLRLNLFAPGAQRRPLQEYSSTQILAFQLRSSRDEPPSHMLLSRQGRRRLPSRMAGRTVTKGALARRCVILRWPFDG